MNDGKDKVSREKDVFQIDELVYAYRVAPFTKLEQNSHFHVTKNTYVHVDINELNDILNTK